MGVVMRDCSICTNFGRASSRLRNQCAVQTRRPEAPVECFDIGIVSWLPWAVEVEGDTVGIRP
jgi:hypothetical protein